MSQLLLFSGPGELSHLPAVTVSEQPCQAVVQISCMSLRLLEASLLAPCYCWVNLEQGGPTASQEDQQPFLSTTGEGSSPETGRFEEDWVGC